MITNYKGISSKNILPFLLGLNFLIRAVIAARPLKFIDGLAVPDDAYLCLTIARNIAKGLGPLYGTDYTNGFQPLYVFLAAPLYWIFPNDPVAPIHAALFLLIVFDTATLYMLFRLVARESLSPITPTLIAIAWIVNPYSIWNTLNGMETAVAMFFIVAGFYILRGMMLKRGFPTRTLAWLGTVFGLGMLARIDYGLLAFAFVVYLAVIWTKEKAKAGVIIGRLAVIAAAACAVYLPYAIYQFCYTGEIVPISGEAVRHMSLVAGRNRSTSLYQWRIWMFAQATQTVLRHNAVLIALVFASAVILWRKSLGLAEIRRRLASADSLLLFSVLIFAAYAFYIRGPWFYPRYLYPIALLFLIWLAVLLDTLVVSLSKRSARTAVAAAFITIALVMAVVRPSFRLLFNSSDTTLTGYMNLGLWARDNFPDGTAVGSSQTGALGYFATNLKVVNLDGVVNRPCFDALKARRNMEYIRQTGIEYVIGWEINIDFVRWETADYRDDDLVFVDTIPGFKSWWNDWLLYKVNYREKKIPSGTPAEARLSD